MPVTSPLSLAAVAVAAFAWAPNAASAQLPAFGGGLQAPLSPPENPLTAAKANLGRALFWDEQLSSVDATACATCHLPEAAGADPRTIRDLEGSRYIGWDRILHTEDDPFTSLGHSGQDASGRFVFRKGTEMGAQLTLRNAPMVFDSAYIPALLHDGKATGEFRDPVTNAIVSASGAALETQAVIPFRDPKEMGYPGRPIAEIIDDVESAEPLALASAIPADFVSWIAGRSYPQLFDEAFGTDEISLVRMGQALAAYQRTLVTHGYLPFDAFLDGDTNALTAEERRGYAVFMEKGCAQCHPGAIMADHEFRHIGLDGPNEDVGHQFVTGRQEDLGRFRTPSLRNIALTAPYFHDGSALTLAEAVEYFDSGARHSVPNLDPLIVPLGMSTAEKADLVAFLGRPLTDPRAAQAIGPYERIGLYAESTDAPARFGQATAGSNGLAPEIVVLEPTRLGRTINVAVSRTNPGAVATLIVSSAQDPLGSAFHGATLHVGMGLGSAATAHRLLTRGPGFGEGSASTLVQLPSDPALLGVEIFAQWLVFDPRPTGRLSASAAIRMKLRE